MNEPSGYTYRTGGAQAVSHLKRYPRHYGTFAVFVLGLLLMPRIGGPNPTQLAGSSHATTPGAVALADAGAAAGSDPAAAVGDMLSGIGITPEALAAVPAGPLADALAPGDGQTGRSPTPTTPALTPATTAPPGDSGEPLPGGVALPPPPALPLPPIPAELQPLFEVVSPLTGLGCSAVGLAAVVAAVVAPTAEGVPVAQIMPYLAPLYTVCATVGTINTAPTICALDEQARAAGYPADVSGLAPTPNVIGMGMDVIINLEKAIQIYTGQSLGIAAPLYEQLGCHPDAG